MNNTRWTTEDDDRLEEMFDNNLSRQCIASALGRTQKSISHRLILLQKTKRNLLNIQIGSVYGALTVINIYKRKVGNRKRERYLVRCRCGAEVEVEGWHLVSGQKTHRGCTQLSKIGYGKISGTFIGMMRRRARKANMEFDVDVQYLDFLFEQQGEKCALTGQKLCIVMGRFDKGTTASVDRIDNSKGYIVGNLQFVHKDINIMRGALSVKHFKELCHMVINHSEKSSNE